MIISSLAKYERHILHKTFMGCNLPECQDRMLLGVDDLGNSYYFFSYFCLFLFSIIQAKKIHHLCTTFVQVITVITGQPVMLLKWGDN